jgi:short-subunit dehydrogenase involved in D-alanine esterification of teichoic acids
LEVKVISNERLKSLKPYGKSVLLAGSNGGIERGMFQTLTESGGNVAIMGRNLGRNYFKNYRQSVTGNQRVAESAT